MHSQENLPFKKRNENRQSREVILYILVYCYGGSFIKGFFKTIVHRGLQKQSESFQFIYRYGSAKLVFPNSGEEFNSNPGVIVFRSQPLGFLPLMIICLTVQSPALTSWSPALPPLPSPPWQSSSRRRRSLKTRKVIF